MTSARQSLRARARGISAGIFAAPLGRLAEQTAALGAWGGGIVHFDIMDGVFVPEITAGPGFVAALGAEMVRDVHLMVAQPARQVAGFAKAGADIITVHAEAPDAAQAIAAIRAAESALGRPILAGLAVMPGTELASLRPLLAQGPDMILSLALDPRTGTPPDLPLAGERLRELAAMAAPAQPLLALDGGVTEATIATAAAYAPDLIVSGSAIFRAADPAQTFARLTAAWAAGAGTEARHV